MNYKSAPFFALLLASFASAQSGPYGQCGGQGWSGSTSCVSGYTCTVLNDWYHQCLPGSNNPAPPVTTQPPPVVTPPPPAATTTPNNPAPTQGGTELPFGTLVTGCSVPNTIAITFDDGPYTWTSGLIDSLDRAGVKATFFVVGRMYGCIYDYADVLKKAYNSGHQIASHTWSHANLSGQSESNVRNEMTRLETALQKILGIRPKWFRPPYGAQNQNLLNIMRSLRYKTVTWNLDTEDWNNVSVQTSQAKFNALNNNRDPKIIPPRSRRSPIHRPTARSLDCQLGQPAWSQGRHPLRVLGRAYPRWTVRHRWPAYA
ncbi:chitin deacetylase [Coprinopsis cinerea AmutBmut pab1-1]|nr:chitin deacetylase [Coprinopsis cinerea AmutBmut pab1-1]